MFYLFEHKVNKMMIEPVRSCKKRKVTGFGRQVRVCGAWRLGISLQMWDLCSIDDTAFPLRLIVWVTTDWKRGASEIGKYKGSPCSMA
jgi:hypothetical protein